MDKTQVKDIYKAGEKFRKFLSEVYGVIEEFEKEIYLKEDVKDDIKEIKRRIWKIEVEKNIYPNWLASYE